MWAVARPAAGPVTSAQARAALAQIVAADRALAEQFTEVGRRLREAGIGGEVEGRRERAEVAVRGRIHELVVAAQAQLDLLESAAGETGAAPSAPSLAAPLDHPVPAAVAQRMQSVLSPLVAALLEEQRSTKVGPLLRAATLPYACRDLAPRPPREVPVIVPSYAQVVPAEPGSADLAGSLEAPLSPEILRQAEALAHDPVRIFELVRNQVRSELYAGSLRGAEGAMRAKSGNDVDQSSLLIALLRSSGIPSRYVRGVALHSIEGCRRSCASSRPPRFWRPCAGRDSPIGR